MAILTMEDIEQHAEDVDIIIPKRTISTTIENDIVLDIEREKTVDSLVERFCQTFQS